MKELKTPSEAKLSSTILLLKGDADPEVLMVVRSYEIDFASGAYVFPGGKVSEDDRLPEWQEHVSGSYEGDDLAVRIGGIREVFEESGILLARSADAAPGTHVGQNVCERLAEHRGAVDRREMSFLGLIKENNLILCLDDLVPYAHWITPEMMPKRFDTRFFVAVAPEEQIAVHDGRETTDAVWVQPGDILAKAEKGEATVIFPTRLNLEMLEDLGARENVLAVSRTRSPIMVMPVVERRDNGAFLVIPKEAGYRVTEEKFESVEKSTAARTSG